MTAPVTTIIIPVYNGERFLAPLLDSVLAQSTENWKCICVDDANADSARELISRYKKATLVQLPETVALSWGNNAALPYCTKTHLPGSRRSLSHD